MTTGTDGGSESLFRRIKTLEGLIIQQKEFIDHTSTVWRGLLETEQARSRQNEDIRSSLESRLAQMEADLTTKLEMLEDLTQRLAQEQSEKSDLQRYTAKAEALLDSSRTQVQTLEQDVARAENILRQRQEEIEQTLSLLEEHRERVSSLELEIKEAEEREAALQNKLGDANGWVFKLAEERADQQSKLSSLTRDRDAKLRELDAAKSQMARLRDQIDLLTSKNAALKDAVKKAATQSTSGAAGRAASSPFQPALMDSVKHRDKSMLLQRLTGAETSPPEARPEPVEATPSATPRMRVEASVPENTPQRREIQPAQARQAMPMVVQTRNLETERLLREAREQTEWLRQLAVAAFDKPREWWWRFMPVAWQQQRRNEKLHQSGLFDGEGYLSRYPDVAAAGADPLRHYLMHGILESRER